MTAYHCRRTYCSPKLFLHRLTGVDSAFASLHVELHCMRAEALRSYQKGRKDLGRSKGLCSQSEQLVTALNSSV